MAGDEDGLGNQATLSKIDKLRELNVGAMVPLPQIIVVGDQSSGKSSVLQSLTNFYFPRGSGLCTRYVTQITCCREADKSVSISIIPRPDADEALKARLLQFQRRITDINNDDLTKIFEDANLAMGIRMSTTDADVSLSAFSQDILKIEICGPDQDHLTVIDVPGIFRVATPGLTTESDISLVENMVKSYMSNRRTIILAIMPCNVDIATQEILKLAEIADPSGNRTMGVLTKPDLATETATKDAIINLVLGKRSILRLGYYIVKNRSADDNNSTVSDRLNAEKAFFTAPPWSSVPDRCGTVSLKVRLRELLLLISKQEIPHVRSEIEQRLLQSRTALETMGPTRADQSSQRLYLGKLASRFQAITQAALNGYYAEDKIFKGEINLKLSTKMIKLNEAFSNIFWKRGHQQHFGPRWDDEGENPFGHSDDDLPFEIPLVKYPELEDIILINNYECPRPLKGPIMSHIEEVFESSRGPELGTFGGTILATVFEEQSEKWEPLVLSHTSSAIALVHDYIFELLSKLCPETEVRNQLWDALLVDKLRDKYHRAMDHARFLLAIERRGRPVTFNHYFNATLQKKRVERISQPLENLAVTVNHSIERYVPLSKLHQHANDKDNGQQVREDILDTLMSYYKVSRKRFVDVICQQVVYHFLLEGDESPLKIFGPDLVMSLDVEQLEQIAGEDAESRRKRQVLGREIERLEGALKHLPINYIPANTSAFILAPRPIKF